MYPSKPMTSLRDSRRILTKSREGTLHVWRPSTLCTRANVNPSHSRTRFDGAIGEHAQKLSIGHKIGDMPSGSKSFVSMQLSDSETNVAGYIARNRSLETQSRPLVNSVCAGQRMLPNRGALADALVPTYLFSGP